MQNFYSKKQGTTSPRSIVNFILFRIVFMTLLSVPVAAQNYIVNSNLDAPAVNLVTGETAVPGQITLRSAIQAATAQPGAHIITFSGAVVSPINLTLGQITVGNAAAGNNISVNGPGMTLLTVNQTTDNRVFFTGTGAITFVLQNITLNFTGPGTVPYSGGGGAIIAGGALASTTLTNVTISNFNQQIGNGGAISQSSSLNNHSLIITNCIFTNNRCGGAGGAVSFNSQGGTAVITGCTFTNNHTGVVGANTGGDGGAISTTGGGSGGTYTIERNTFLNNQVENVTGHAGAVMNTNGTLTLRYNRFIGNTCANVAFPPLANIVGQAGGATTHVTIADNNWWGVNTGPGTNDATALAAGAVMTLTKWLQLKTTASPNPICNTPAGLGNTTTVTTSFLSNSASEAIAVANLPVLIGLPVTWGPTTLGSLSGQQGTIQASGTATALFTSNGTGGTATVNTQVDNVPAGEISPSRANITVNTLPTVTNPVNTTACVGGTAIFTSTITGTPVPTITWRIGAVVLVNGVQGSGSTVSGATTNTLTITNVQVGDASANYNVQANNQCGTATSANATLTVNAVTGGTVAADQTICSGGDPAAFTESVASTGSGVLTYQWQSSTTSCAAGFSNIGGATATTYDPPAGLAITTYYRRMTTSTLNAVPCTANSNCITVTVNSVTGGTVAADQTICSGGDPAAFTQSVASTGSGALTYQWQSSTTSCAAGFSNIAGATGTTYDPPAGLLVTTYYRRMTTSTLNAVPCTANSNCITVSVNDVTGGTVAADQTVCSGGDPTAFTESVASTGSGALTYQWQSSTTSCAAGFSNIAGATSSIYDPPAGLLVTTYYRRVTTSTLNAVPCTANSNCITVTVNDVTGGTVAADQTICSGGDPAAFTETVASTGSGTLTYQWQSSTTSCAAGFSNIAGATGIIYDGPSGLAVTTYYRRVTTSTLNAVPCTANSNCITVTVNAVTGGTVAADQTICSGGDPAAFTQTVASTGSGALTYQWQSSTTSCAAGFSNIAGATGTTYDAPAGVAVTTYYRRVTTSTLNAVPCTANSNCITVTISPDNTVSLTSAPGTDNQSVLINTPITNITYATTIATGAIVTGLPAGVTGNWAANVVTISGTPTVTGSFNYTVTLTGGCGTATATGTIMVFDCTITLTSAAGTNAQTVCNNTAITNITYSTTGATGANFSGLPPGVNGNWAANVVTISGNPTASGTFSYTVSPIGAGCAGITATGTITVNPIPGVDPVANQVVCHNDATLPVNFTGTVPGTVFNWTNNTPSIGLAASGTGNIASFTATNTTNAPVVATVTVTPSSGGGASGLIPELLYYKFDGSGTSVPNLASAPPPGTATATINGGLSQGGSAICNGTIIGSGAASSTDFVNTGWAPNLGASSWTISFKSENITPSATLFYCFGDLNSTSFRCFTNGVAGPNNWILRGAGLTDITISGGATVAPHTNTFVYDNTLNQVRAYLDGALVSTVAQGAVNLTGAGPFKVNGYSGNVGSPLNGHYDEFSVFNRVLTPAEVLSLASCPATGPICTGTPETFTYTVNPIPNAVATPASQTVCSGVPITTIVLTGAVSGTTYNWTRDNTAAVTGIAASGSGDISGALTNTTTAPLTVTFTISPTANGCPGVPVTATVLVNPTPNAVATPSSQIICSATPIITIVLTGTVSGTTYAWTRDNLANLTGIAASGSGNISGTLTNTTNVVQVTTFTIIPTANGCPGAPITATVMVNPTPTVSPVPPNQTVCNQAPTAPVIFTGPVAGTTFNWVNNTASIGLAASGTGNIASFNAINISNVPVVATITVTPVYINGGISCTGTPVNFTITVNPTPTVNAVANQIVCNNAATTAVTFSGAIPGTVFNWTNNTVSIGLAASGTGNIASFTAINITNAPVTANITVTPSYTIGGVTCSGTPRTFTITVNPTPTVNAVANQTVCSGSTVLVTFNGFVPGTVYNWTNTNTAIGLAPSGTGNLNFTASNPTAAPIAGTITVTPNYSNGGITCTGPPITFVITVNPTPTVNPVANQLLCNGSSTASVTFSGTVTGTVYNWINNNTGIGLAASGAGNIPGFTATNTTNAPITGTITVTPTFTAGGITCTGSNISFTITVNPTPSVNAIANQVLCAGAATTAVTITGPAAGTVFSWTNDNTTIGLGVSGTGNIPAFVTINPTTSPVTATITVTPTYTNGGVSCTGPARTFTITVNPLPNIIFTNTPPRVCLTDTLVTLRVTPTGGTWAGKGVSGSTFSAAAAGVGVHTLSYTVTNANGCTATAYVNVTVNDCIDRHNVFATAIRLWPNPSNGQFKIRFNSDLYKEFKVKIVSSSGQELGYYEFKGLVYGSIIPMDLRKLPNGMYFLYVYNTKESGVFKFVIAH